MSERKFLARFTQKFKKKFPKGFIYKIPDTMGLGGMRPFDMIVILDGTTYCIEAKASSRHKLTPYQEHNLEVAESNGAHTLVLYPENEGAVFLIMESKCQKKTKQ